MNELKTNSTELDVPVKSSLAPVDSAVFEVDPNKPEDAVMLIDNAVTVPLQANMEMWDPAESGDSMTGLLKGFVILQMRSLTDPNRIEDVECAVLYTPRDVVDPRTGDVQGQKLVQIAIAAKRAVSFLKNVPVKTMWRIVFKGEQKNKTNQFKSKIFEFYQMIRR